MLSSYKTKKGDFVTSALDNYSGFALRGFKSSIKNAVTDEAKQKLQKKHDIILLGTIAHLLSYSTDELELHRERQSKVVFMIGLQNAGKSTYIKKHLQDYTIISFDDLITKMWGDNYNEAYQQYLASSAEKKEIIKLQNRLKFTQTLLNRGDIVLDFTSLSKSFIEGFYDLIPIGYKKEIVVLDTDFKTILERNKSRKDKFIPIEVLENERELFEKKEFELFEWDREIYIGSG